MQCGVILGAIKELECGPKSGKQSGDELCWVGSPKQGNWISEWIPDGVTLHIACPKLSQKKSVGYPHVLPRSSAWPSLIRPSGCSEP